MTLYQEIIAKYALRNLYVPWGWSIQKNNLINRDHSLLNEYKTDSDRFKIEDHFFYSTIFDASNEIRYLNTTIKSNLSVSYNFLMDKQEIYNFCYTIDLYIHVGKKIESVYSYSTEVNHIEQLVTEVNFLLTFISNFLYEKQDPFDNDINDFMLEVKNIIAHYTS